MKSCDSLPCRALKLYLKSEEYPTAEEKYRQLQKGYEKLFWDVSKDSEGDRLKSATLGAKPIISEENFRENLLNLLVVTLEFEIPLWLIAREPELLWHDTGTCYMPFAIHIHSDDAFSTSEAWMNFSLKQKKMHGNYWYEGTSHKIASSSFRRQEMMLKYGPHMFLNYNSIPAEYVPFYEPWSFQGPWNRRTYKEFQETIKPLKAALKAHYTHYDYLREQADTVDEYLTLYLGTNTHTLDDDVYMALRVPGHSLQDLQSYLKNLPQEDWNRALSYAILNDYDLDVISWMINEGANINAYVHGEPILIKAVDRPDILRYLLDKGAEVDAGTFYGKTALFYAVQLQNMGSVKLLLEYGADGNAQLLSEIGRDLLYNLEGNEYVETHLEEVLGFTPLAYSVRYGTPEISRELITHGARIDGVDLKRLEKWIDDKDRYTQQMLLVQRAQEKKPNLLGWAFTRTQSTECYYPA